MRTSEYVEILLRAGICADRDGCSADDEHVFAPTSHELALQRGREPQAPRLRLADLVSRNRACRD